MSNSDSGTPSSPSSPGSSPPHSVRSTGHKVPPSSAPPSRSPSSASRSHARRLSSLGSLQQQVTPSPLGSTSSARHRRTQSSFSSNVSTTTDATSYDGSGEECQSQDGTGEKESIPATSTSSPGTLNSTKRHLGSTSTEYLWTGGGTSNPFVLSGSSPHAISIAPPSSLPLSVTTALPPASVRLSTTPLFPSPLAQASGPDEEHDHHRGEEGDAESGDEDEERLQSEPAWSGTSQRRVSRDTSGPFGDLELSPPHATIPLPELNALTLEPNVTPRPVNPPRQRHSPTSPREDDTIRTARAPRVRSLGRASGLSQALLAADDAAALSNSSKRRSRHGDLSVFNGSGGVGGSSGNGGSYSLNSTPTRSSTLSSISTSPPSPSTSSNPSVSPSTVSRRASINLASPPRFFQPGSPTGSSRNTPRTSMNPNSNPLPIPIPAPFPAAPPPSESIKLQRVPESVRSALDFRQSNLSSSHGAGDHFGNLSRSFQNGSPVDLKLPKTPTATRAPSPASGSGNSSPSDGRSVPASQVHSREGSRRASRQSSREKLSASGGSPSSATSPSTPATSAFSPLFPFQSSSPGMTRSRSKSVSGGGLSSALRQDIFRSSQAGSEEPVSPRSAAQQGLGVSPSFFPLDSTRGSSLHPRTASDSYSSSVPKNHRTSASISGITPAPSSRLVNHRISIAPTDLHDGTDEYAQIIMSTRNAKVRKWRPASPAPEAGGSGIKSWSLAGGRNNSTLGEQMEEAGDDEAEPGEGWLSAPPKEIEWVDWLDEYRKLKEAKLRADGAGTTVEEIKKEEEPSSERKDQEPKGEKEEVKQLAGEPEPKKKEQSPTRSEGSDRKSDSSSRMAEPALAAAQKGKAKATTATEFNPFEATTASMARRDFEPRPFLTPGVSYSSPYFPLTATSTSTSPVIFHPSTTATPLLPSEPSDFSSSLKPSTSHSNSGSSYVGSPGVKRRRNFAKLGNKIDAWWSAVRTSFAGAEDDRGSRHRRTSIDQTTPYNLKTGTIEPSVSRTSSQYVRPSTPGTPGLRNVASAHDLVRVTSASSPPPPPNLVPRGALAPAARSQSTGRLRAPSDRQRTISSGSEQESSDGATSKSRRNPNLSLNLGPSFNSMVRQPEQAYLSNKVSPRTESSSSPINTASFGLSPPVADDPALGPRSAPENIPRPVSIPHSAAGGSIVMNSPGFTPSDSPVWDRTPALVPTAAHFPVRNRQVTMPNKLPSEMTAKETEQEKKNAERPGFSMHTVRSQIRQRLASAKENCDNELRRIIEGISTFVEKDLQQEIATPLPHSGFDEGRFGELVQDDLAGGYTSSPDVESEGEVLIDTDHADSDGGSGTRRPPTRLKTSHLSPSSESSPGQRRSFDAGAPRRTSLVPRHRHLTSVPRDGSSSRSKPGSNSSSRSNSRSRSPLPPGLRRASAQRSPAPGFLLAANSKLAEGAFIVLLQEIITVATEILDTPINKLTARPGSCAEYIGKVQQIGEAWNENPELPCRGWYVQLLLAVAGLSRVVEWWEAEKGFWSFDEGDNEDAEPIVFISKGDNSEDSPEIRARTDTLSVPALSPSSSSQPARWSPLGIDLGVPDDSADAQSTRSREPTASITPEDTKTRAEELKHAVEAITAQTLLMELSLDGQLFQYLSSAWQDLVGVDPEDCLDAPISDFLFPDDAAVFAEATRQLEADDSHTVEVNFRLRVASSSQASLADDEDEDDLPPEDLYEAMEGKGMLMLDGLSGSASHTMWVVRPAPFSETAAQAHESLARFGLDTFHRRSSSDPGVFFAPGGRINLEPILCRICERPTPAWFFEKHNETCNEVHRLEGDIGECNDRLKDLLRSLGELVVALDQARNNHDDENESTPEYRGIPLNISFSPLPSPSAPGEADEARQHNQHFVFAHVREIVETALAISNPSVSDESGEIPIQDQRLLSPHSETNLAAILHWQRPRVDDAALVRLLSDTEESIRFKLNSVNRLRNTILYAEKVRQEWETKASEAIYAAQEKERAEQSATLPFDSPQLQPLPPSDDSPKGMEYLELPRPSQTLRRQASQNQGLLSPMLLPEDANSPLSVSPSAQLLLSPRLPSAVPSSRTRASSIKDFKILKPISKGAFGSVYLAKKVTTGDYYAIKVLKKSDMVAKNQVTNVKAERMILMTTAESNFVVKLYYTFQSRDYLYLVMEYLNGGDCGALVKNLGGLTEDWAKKYVAEVVVGLEHLHSSGVIHRDLKPDNLLIDAKGHLKLTDFGLSRIGLLGRQTQMPGLRDVGQHVRRPSAPARSSSNNPKEFSTSSSPLATPALGNAAQTSYFGNVPLTDSFSLDTPSESSASGSLHASGRGNQLSPTWTSGTGSKTVPAGGPSGAGAEPSKHNFVGTPDYLAPESILGIGMDACVDWWALGVISYEFIYGFPPFHDETPEKVFDNILSRRFDWHEGEIDISADARDFIDRLLCTDARRRLGVRGAEEVKAHPFLDGVDWDNLLKGPVEFVPNVDDPESTDYFDARGAQNQNFNDEEPDPSLSEDPVVRQTQGPTPASTPGPGREPRDRSETAPNPHDDFGTFSFRNLTVLKQANDDVIRKMKDEQLLPPLTNPLSIPANGHDRSRNNSIDAREPISPSSRSISSVGSQPLRAPDSASSSPLARPNPDSSLIERSRPRQPVVGFHPRSTGNHHVRRNSMPSRLRKSSVQNAVEDPAALREEVKKAVLTENWAAHSRRTSTDNGVSSALSSPERDPRNLPPLLVPSPQTPEARSAPIDSLTQNFQNRLPPATHPATIDCLVAGRNPIVTKVLETMLQRLGCRVVVVPNGAEAILAAGGIPFDVLFLDLKMAVVDGEKAARMIKSTVNPSAQAPIVAVCSHPAAIDDAAGTLFTATLSKPIMKADLLHVLSYLGFKLETKGDVLRRGSGDSEAVASTSSENLRRGSA
ncbi:uncharacterized protein JCM6883_006866 [Sporobolomyces salmoneus]|uniref:uncharacterized protein n=1 Tax=Sporobolomyces salmoneus TaxID=183962 RepID=UPI00316EDDC5